MAAVYECDSSHDFSGIAYNCSHGAQRYYADIGIYSYADQRCAGGTDRCADDAFAEERNAGVCIIGSKFGVRFGDGVYYSHYTGLCINDVYAAKQKGAILGADKFPHLGSFRMGRYTSTAPIHQKPNLRKFLSPLGMEENLHISGVLYVEEHECGTHTTKT